MNFSLWQWLSSIALDVLIKVPLITILGLSFTYGFGAILGFVCLAIGFSILNFTCLFLGCTFVLSFELVHLKLPRALQRLLSLGTANITFVLIFTGLAGSQIGPNDVGPTVFGQMIIGLILAVTNLISILIVLASGRLARLAAR